MTDISKLTNPEAANAGAENAETPSAVVTPRGKISLVGIGPGSNEHMTQKAREVIAQADCNIG